MAKSNPLRAFISHSSFDKDFATKLAATLRDEAVSPWIDKEQILAGDDVLEGIGEGLQKMDLLIFLVSNKALQSPWVNRELKFAARREIEEKQVLVLPFIIDGTPSQSLPWFLQHSLAIRVTPDDAGVATILSSIKERVERRTKSGTRSSASGVRPTQYPEVDRIIERVGLGQWKRASEAALDIIRQTDATGRNQLWEKLLEYQNLPDDDSLLWSALHTIEMCADLAPPLMSRPELHRMATHPNFSVRSSAASICMNWAQFAPALVPVDMLLPLSAYDEDWYVHAPANAALKSMVRAMPSILQTFYSRLRSVNAEEREHAAACLFDIANKEPDLLDKEELTRASEKLQRIDDVSALEYVRKAESKAKGGDESSRYKYGL